jgi:hypothetical protein
VKRRVAREDDILDDLLLADSIEEIEAKRVDKALQAVISDVEVGAGPRRLELEWIREALIQRSGMVEAVRNVCSVAHPLSLAYHWQAERKHTFPPGRVRCGFSAI